MTRQLIANNWQHLSDESCCLVGSSTQAVSEGVVLTSWRDSTSGKCAGLKIQRTWFKSRSLHKFNVMKIRNVKHTILKRHLRLDARNKRHSLKMLRTGKGTEEQLEMAPTCIKLDDWLMHIWTPRA